jgi:cell volume regulation protein A
MLARDRVEGDGVDWHGARFRVSELIDDRVARVSVHVLRNDVRRRRGN